jgi:hypothetical protein
MAQRGEREGAGWVKKTVYLTRSQAKYLEASGLEVKDVLERGFMLTPIGSDTAVPEQYRDALALMARVMGVLAAGGRLYTATASEEFIAEDLRSAVVNPVEALKFPDSRSRSQISSDAPHTVPQGSGGSGMDTQALQDSGIES